MAISDEKFYELKATTDTHSKEIGDLRARVGDVEKKQEMLYEMNSNIALIAQSLQRVEGDMGEVKENQKELSVKVSTLENAPAKETLDNIKKIKIAAISAIVSGAAVVLAGAAFAALASK